MGKVIDAVAELKKDNKETRGVLLQVYGDALRIYCEAADNVRRNGAVCAHPRTGAPMENPYLKIQQTQGAILAKIQGVRSDRVLALLLAQYEQAPA